MIAYCVVEQDYEDSYTIACYSALESATKLIEGLTEKQRKRRNRGYGPLTWRVDEMEVDDFENEKRLLGL